jgi:hypothetical protein
MSNTSNNNPKDEAQSDRIRDQQLAYTTRSKEYPPKPSTPLKNEEKIRRLDAAKAKFEQLLPELLREHAGKYAVILDDSVEIDQDKNRLLKTVIKKYGYKTMYLGKISTEERTVFVPTPL